MRAICERHGVSYGHYGRGGQKEVYEEVTAQRLAGEQLTFDLGSSEGSPPALGDQVDAAADRANTDY
jgi:hypothetical protein